MDRQIIYFGQLPREVDLLNTEQNMMVALAKLAEAVLGTSVLVDGFTAVPTTPASLNIILNPGSLYQLENLEQSVMSALPADLSHTILKQGIQLDPVVLGITPPVTVGYSQVYLVQVQYQDLDTGSTVLPYYNAANPTSNYSGPGNSGAAQNTVRKGAIAVQLKAGTAAATGTQVAPSADAGWTGLFTVTVANGATSISSGNIVRLSTAPFLLAKLPDIPGAVQSGKWLWGTDTGTANAVVLTSMTPAVSALVPGLTVRFKKATANNSGAMTINAGLGASAFKKSNGADFSAGDITVNAIVEATWDGSQWQATNYLGLQSSTSTVTNNITFPIPFCVDSSSTPNSIVAPFSPAITSLSVGDLVRVKVARTVTGPTVIAVNAINVNVTRPDASSLQGGDIVAGQIVLLEYDGSEFQVVNLSSSAPPVGGTVVKVAGTFSFTVPAGIFRLKRVRGQGGGGSGGGSNSGTTGATGGGGGGWFDIFDLPVTPGQVITGTVGSGSVTVAGSADGTAGTATNFGTFGSATGGGGGKTDGSAGGASGAGSLGVGVNGDVGLGQGGGFAPSNLGGQGGGSIYGGGGLPTTLGGGAGVPYGAGGAGGFNFNAGGVGADGRLVISY